MSTWQLLELSYSASKICPGRMCEDIILIAPEQMARYQAFRGHFLAYLEPYLGRKLATFTILRDPVQRTISHYCHARRSPEHPFHDEANTLSLAEFCVHPRTRHMVLNYQSAYLACPGNKNPRELSLGMTREDLTAYKLQLALDPAPDEFPDASGLFDAAIHRLRGFAAVGITERLQDSLVLIARALGLAPPPLLPLRNVATNRPDRIDPDTERVIRANTQVDQAVYDWARRIVEQQAG